MHIPYEKINLLFELKMSYKVWIDHISTTTSNIFKTDLYNFFNKYVLNIVKPSNEIAFEFYEKGIKNNIFFEINYLKWCKEDIMIKDYHLCQKLLN